MSLDLLVRNGADELVRSWPAEPRLTRRPNTHLERAVTMGLLDSYIDHGLLAAQHVAVVKDGQAAHPGRYSRDGAVRAERLRALFDEGFTINLRELQLRMPYLAEMSTRIRDETGYPNHVSAIITPPGERGLAHHWDQFTGIVTQLAGHKRWQLWRPVVEHPTGEYLASPDLWNPELQKRLENSPPDAEFELVPGDTLLLPRGWLHNPFSVGVETSLHLTFAVKERTWLWLAQQLLGMAVHDTSFRREMPPGAHRSGLASEIGTAAAMAIGFLNRLDPIAAEEWVRGQATADGP
ncbi:JmjC domain-containing protein [Streptomyces millisiae]|uniref:Cupin domain-containing protein n=1 Tax=Streptomyces millisiae TaxID=3075542 RepID=A0ABU2LPM0_9ACTN|nr:cupin domain-containing protein [Streptomyces sp. DSM 44918]MDT0319529.1 cupin domain-containing protein [Streptomyces sp. DSM 44918]